MNFNVIPKLIETKDKEDTQEINTNIFKNVDKPEKLGDFFNNMFLRIIYK